MDIIRIMTFNIRGSFYMQDGVNLWKNRAELNVKVIKRYKPDIIGFQELQVGNLQWYQNFLSEYQYILGPKYNNEEPHNYNAIFWNPIHFELIDSGGFWLSNTPEKFSSDWGTRHVRSVNWIILRHINTNFSFLHVNTHLDHISELARKEGSRIIVQKIDKLQSKKVPIVLTGDFNSNPDSAIHRIFLEVSFVDTYSAVGNLDTKDTYTIHAFEGERYLELDKRTRFSRIDWILIKGFKTKSCSIVRDHEAPFYPSDHYPVLAELILVG